MFEQEDPLPIGSSKARALVMGIRRDAEKIERDLKRREEFWIIPETLVQRKDLTFRRFLKKIGYTIGHNDVKCYDSVKKREIFVGFFVGSHGPDQVQLRYMCSQKDGEYMIDEEQIREAIKLRMILEANGIEFDPDEYNRKLALEHLPQDSELIEML